MTHENIQITKNFENSVMRKVDLKYIKTLKKLFQNTTRNFKLCNMAKR